MAFIALQQTNIYGILLELFRKGPITLS